MRRAARPDGLRRVAAARMPTRWGEFQTIGFERDTSNGRRRIETALAMVFGDPSEGTPLLRIHSQCQTGEVLGSLRCDCRDQLEIAFRAIAAEGRGLVIYEHQEGRGIGLMAKLQAYELQDLGLDTIEANLRLGFSADDRNYQLPIAILRHLGIGRVRLLSNNPDKARALAEAGIEVAAQIPCEAAPTSHSYEYLRTKQTRMGHALSLRQRRECASIDEAIGELRAGRMVVVVDDEDRENEGDLLMAADTITPEAVNFMATHGRGLICLATTGQRLDELRLDQMPGRDALGGTAFAVSIDVKGRGVTTGISAHDRAQTIRAAIDTRTRREDFAVPGHVFPLRARPGGVLIRRGQTETAVDVVAGQACTRQESSAKS